MTFGSTSPDADVSLASKFLLEIDGVAVSAYEKVIIPGSEYASIDNRTGADSIDFNKSSGLRKTNNLVFEKKLRVDGFSDIKEIINWHQQGSAVKKDGSIILNDHNANEVARWNFKGAWVQKMDDVELDANKEDSEVLFHFELAVSKVEVA